MAIIGNISEIVFMEDGASHHTKRPLFISLAKETQCFRPTVRSISEEARCSGKHGSGACFGLQRKSFNELRLNGRRHIGTVPVPRSLIKLCRVGTSGGSLEGWQSIPPVVIRRKYFLRIMKVARPKPLPLVLSWALL